MVSQVLPVHAVEMAELDNTQRNTASTSRLQKDVSDTKTTGKWVKMKEKLPFVKSHAQESTQAPSARCNPTGPCGKACFQLGVFTLTNVVVVFFLFVFPQITEYQYLKEYDEKVKDAAYSFLPSSIELDVDDGVDGIPRDWQFLSEYTGLVNIPDIDDEDPNQILEDYDPPGWNLQDILDLPRAIDSGDEYRDPITGKRMVQDYRLCESGCLDSLGRPIDMYDAGGNPTRDFSLEPYGILDTDVYVDRDTILEEIDYDFYHSFISNDGGGDPRKESFGNFGLSSMSSNLSFTGVSSAGYICNLGRQRIVTTRIVIKTHECHLQIASTEGDKYRLFVKQRHRKGLKASINMLVEKDMETGCRTQELVIEVSNPNCRRVQVPGVEYPCERECNVVLFKGDKARRIPIHVEPLGNSSASLAHFRVEDQYLVLDSLGRDDEDDITSEDYEYDLSVAGGSMNVDLANARIKRLHVDLKYGTVNIDHLRNDVAKIKIEADDVAIQDDRNYELWYRSAAEFLCLAAPLIETIPSEFLACNMEPDDDLEKHAHKFYDDKLDGYIDHAEFMAGMEVLGITGEEDSLDLNERQMQDLIDHVFSYSEPDAAVQELTYELFQEQLEKVMPAFTTLYDSDIKHQCLDLCTGRGGSVSECRQECTWYCGNGAINITEPLFGMCDISQGCSPSCGTPDTSINGDRGNEEGEIDFHFYDADPPDGVITMEEMRQALLKLYGNCTYIIEPYERDYVTCAYVGKGQYDLGDESVRRECTRYSIADRIASGQVPFDYNDEGWRIQNPNLPQGTADTLTLYGTQPRECRPFPDYDPKLNGRQFDASVTQTDCPECFLLDGSLVPPHYYNRSTWDSANYQNVHTHLRHIFTIDRYGNHFPYFNISDDDQFRQFAAKIFTRTVIEERVPYSVFNANLQTLARVDGVGDNFYVFNPYCFRGKFLKTAPGDYSANNVTAVVDNASIAFANGTRRVQNTNMPGFRINSQSSDDQTNPCPEEWGDGTQGSTSFSYFPWADSMVGRKWGKALPVWCYDEAWPDGGENGIYPDDESKYGSMAGKEIPPGCEPAACKPLMAADVIEGSIHAQVLPFEFQPRNSTGSYHNMLKNCGNSDGSSKCFLKGYDAHMEDRFRHIDQDKLEEIKNDWVNIENAPDDSVVTIDVHGFGAPNFKKWFWASRGVYMQLEPPWLNVFSLGVLDPRMVVTEVRMTPGICDKDFGAVEQIDWRDNATYGSRGATLGIRLQREARIYSMLNDNIRPDGALSARGKFYLKQVWRQSYEKEEQMFDEATYNPLTDTDPGFIDQTGKRVRMGPFFRHKRACASDQPCDHIFAVYRDNCLEERHFLKNETDGGYYLEGCHAEDGTSAYIDKITEEDGLTFNESAYYRQFPRTLGEYGWDEVKSMGGNDVLRRHWYVNLIHHSHANATSYLYDKSSVNPESADGLEFADADGDIFTNIALVMALTLSMLIASVIGLGVMVLLMLLAFQALKRYRTRLANLQKIDDAKREDRFNAFLELVETDYRKELRRNAKEEGRDPASLTAVELALPEGTKERILRFARKHWSPDSDVGEWNVENLKSNWDRHMGVGNSPCFHYSDKDPSLYETVIAVTAQKRKFTPESTAPGTGYASDEEQRGLLTRNMQKTVEIQRKMDQLVDSDTCCAKLRLFLMETARKFQVILKVLWAADLPSPFDVINIVIIDQVRRRLVNSLRTFIKEKCLQNQPMTESMELRLGGTLDELGEFEDDKEIIRLGVGDDVGVAKTVFGKIIRYKVKWVRVWCKKEPRTIQGVETESLVAYVHEGPRVYTNPTMPLHPWEDPSVRVPEIGEERQVVLPGPESPSCGVKASYVVTAQWGTRSIVVNTQGNLDLEALGPTIEFKTVLRNFSPAYEKFCMDYELLDKDVLKSEGTMKSMGIHITKRIVTSVKGLRLKTQQDRAQERGTKHRKSAFPDPENANAIKAPPNQGFLALAVPVGLQFQDNPGHVVQNSNESDSITTEIKEGDLPRHPSAGAQLHLDPEIRRTISEEMGNAISRQFSAMNAMRKLPPLEETIHVSSDTGTFASGMRTNLVQSRSHKLADKVSPEEEDAQREGPMRSSTGTEVPVDHSSNSDSSSDDGSDMQVDLMASNTLLAQFLRSQYVVTENFIGDMEEFEVFKTRYKMWCKRMKTPMESIDTEELFQYGIVYSEQAFHDMFGVVVNERDLTIDPMGSNLHVLYLLRTLSVWLHLLFIWLPVYPLLHVTLYFQTFYSRTTAIQPQLTLEILRTKPETLQDYTVVPINQILLGFCASWLIFCHVKMIAYYLGLGVPAVRNNRVRNLLKSVFWVFFSLILGMLVSYLLFVFCWLILGAVIRPQAFLPYCTAVVTLVAHTRATANHLWEKFNRYKMEIAAAVAAAFIAKIVATLAMAKKKGKKEALPSKEEGVEPYPVFKLYAGDDDTLNYDEFSALLDRFDIEMIEDKRRMFYAKVDADGSGSIGYVEFERAWVHIQREMIKARMREAGITKGRVICLLIYSVVLLLLLFAFIFVGVAAFVGDGAFGAVINSALTAGAGVAMNSGASSDEDEDDSLGIDKVDGNKDDD